MPLRSKRSESKLSQSYRYLGDPITPPTDGELRELISLRAYELYVERGTAEGDEIGDWLKAESEVSDAISELFAPAKKRARALPDRLFKRSTRKPSARKRDIAAGPTIL